MGIEILVFRRNEGLFDHIRNVFGRREQPALLGELINQTAFARIDAADRRRFILRKRFMAWQVVGIHPENATNADSRHHQTHRHHRKDATKERQEKSDHDCASNITCTLHMRIHSQGQKRKTAFCAVFREVSSQF